jgi:hypothetical protein
MDTDGGWGAVLDGVDGAIADGAAATPRGDAWNALDALFDRSSGGDATGNLFARVVALVGAFVPPELGDAAEALLRVAGDTSSWAGAVIDPVPRESVAADEPAVARAPAPVATDEAAAAPPVREARPAPTPATQPPPPTPAREADMPDDPTFDAAIGAGGDAQSMEVTR